MNEQNASAVAKYAPCICTTILGALVIVFAWWPVRWGGIVLTIIGVLLILRGLANQCCCAADSCATKAMDESSASKGESAESPV